MMIPEMHPIRALFDAEAAAPTIATCEHFAGNRKMIEKALELQLRYKGVFDVTCDLEDGAASGDEAEHAKMIASLIASPQNRFDQAGVRIHDPSHPHWTSDVDILLDRCANKLAYITVPKSTSAIQVAEVIEYIKAACRHRGIDREIPIHVLIETHGALAEVDRIAELPSLQVLDFGLMDFVSAHQGAIPFSAMRSPGQFEHHLIVLAKTRVVAAALRNAVVPAHNVSLDLKSADCVLQDATRARKEFGFMRMWSIHPNQIQPIIQAMRPDMSEIADAAAILLQAYAKDWGPIQYKEELHDRATYRYFWNILRRAEMTGMDIPGDAHAAFFTASDLLSQEAS